MATKNTTEAGRVWDRGLCRKLHRRTGVWFYYIRFKTPDGKRRLEKAGTSVKEARKKLKQRLGEVASGRFVDPRAARNQPGPTFQEFADQFLREYAAQRRSTYYADTLHAAIPSRVIPAAPVRAYFGNRRVREITEGDLEAYATHCKVVDEVGDSTTRKRLTILHTMFRWGRRAGILDSNPAAAVDKPKEPKNKTRFLTAQEWDALWEAADPWLQPILTLAVHTSFRLKEVTGLRWEDVDLAKGLLTLSDDNKAAESRAVPMSPTVREVLERAGARFRKTGHVFVDWDGKDYTSDRARNRISQHTISAAKAVGIEGVSFHTLRHTAGSWMAQAGHSQVQIAKVLGHSSTATTDRYMHLAPEYLKAAVDAIEAESKAAQK